MANVDRWRPPREGYQPPPVVAAAAAAATAPPPTAASRPVASSRSPTRQREVPPAVPSPPTHSSRTSPPRPNNAQRDNAQTSSQPSPQTGAQTPLPQERRQWYFNGDEVVSTPTILDGVPPAEERLRRAKGVNFIYQAGVMLDLPQITLWVAGVFFHRFYMRYSMVEERGGIHHYNIAATALFLANKTEENCRKTKDIIITVAKVAQKNSKLIIDEQSKEYWRWRDNILAYEELMLELLTFDLMVDNPYHPMFEMLHRLNIVHNKNLRQSAWAFCNDVCLTSIPLILEARDIAIAAIFFASVHTAQQIPDVEDQAWWKAVNANESRCFLAINMMRQFYTENPLQKRNPSLPSPAFDIQSTRRPKEPLADNNSSTVGTPRESDRPNGGREDGTNTESGSQATLKDVGRTNGNGVSPAPKRKDIDSDSDGQSNKRARLEDEDEGEVPDE